MKIYEMKIAPNPRRVRIFLAEKGIHNVEYIQVDVQGGANLTPEFREKSPMTKIPVLELEDGTCISETVAICRYFEELYPDIPLMGRTPEQKALIEMWQRICEFYFMIPTGMCFQHTSGYFKDRMNPIPEWGAECRDQVLKMLKKLDKQLASNKYIAGDEFSIADITAVCTLDFNKVNQIKADETLPNLQRWHAEMKQRDSYAA